MFSCSSDGEKVSYVQSFQEEHMLIRLSVALALASCSSLVVEVDTESGYSLCTGCLLSSIRFGLEDSCNCLGFSH